MHTQQTSIVLELQRMASDGHGSVTELLRKALLVARKLKIADFAEWVQHELSGYPLGADTPAYREIVGQAVVWNPYHGTAPFQIGDPAFAKVCAQVIVQQSIPEIEQMLASGSVSFDMEFPPDALHLIRQVFPTLGVNIPRRRLFPNSLFSIVEEVRTTILSWSLKLEEEGITGEGMTFSDDEKERAAHSSSVQIGNYFNNVQAHNVQVGDYGSIHQQLKTAGISQHERNEIENILDELPTAKGAQRESLVQSGMDWLGRNGENLGNIGAAIRKVLCGA